jgi:hypothetical protein
MIPAIQNDFSIGEFNFIHSQPMKKHPKALTKKVPQANVCVSKGIYRLAANRMEEPIPPPNNANR